MAGRARELLDVLVVGGGPGGATAAYHLARGGARVALVEREHLPWQDGWTGIVSVLAQECLAGMGLAEWADGYPLCRRVVFAGPRGAVAGHDLTGPRQRALFIPGADMGQALIGAAEAAGVEVHLGVAVRGVGLIDDAIGATASGPLPAARLLVLAEGSEAPLAASLGMVRQPPELVAVQGHYPYDADGTAEFHYLPSFLPCPAWASPSGPGTVRVGLSAFAADPAGNRSAMLAALADLAARRAYGGMLPSAEPLRPPALSRVRSGLHSVVPFAERVLLAGEAAGVVHPLTLEGIGASMESGRIVAQHALYALEKGRFRREDLSAYAKALGRRFQREYRPARLLRALLHSERVLERIVGRAQHDEGFASLVAGLFLGTQSTLGALTPANVSRYLWWWRGGRRRGR